MGPLVAGRKWRKQHPGSRGGRVNVTQCRKAIEEGTMACTAQSVKLNSGTAMPLLGLGTFKMHGYEVVYGALAAALEHGYRAVDTAAVYNNEADVARALRELLPRHGLTRADVFITSKLAPRDQGPGAAAAALQSLGNLDPGGYLDLYLVHWPGTQGLPGEDPRNQELRRESWRLLEKLHGEGKLRAIGVSNYTVRHLEELLATCSIKPSVLQVEYHPHLVQKELLEYCQAHGIHMQAYSSLGMGHLLGEVTVQEVASRLGRTPAQVLLRWALERGVGVIPKSTGVERVASNAAVFDFKLAQEDMEKLDGMDKQLHYCWNPNTIA
ncbi:unnamed protein product [Lampetra fluviatilis]